MSKPSRAEVVDSSEFVQTSTEEFQEDLADLRAEAKHGSFGLVRNLYVTPIVVRKTFTRELQSPVEVETVTQLSDYMERENVRLGDIYQENHLFTVEIFLPSRDSVGYILFEDIDGVQSMLGNIFSSSVSQLDYTPTLPNRIEFDSITDSTVSIGDNEYSYFSSPSSAVRNDINFQTKYESKYKSIPHVQDRVPYGIEQCLLPLSEYLSSEYITETGSVEVDRLLDNNSKRLKSTITSKLTQSMATEVSVTVENHQVNESVTKIFVSVNSSSENGFISLSLPNPDSWDSTSEDLVALLTEHNCKTVEELYGTDLTITKNSANAVTSNPVLLDTYYIKNTSQSLWEKLTNFP